MTRKIEITEAQLKAIKSIADDMEGMIGGADDDTHWLRNIKHVDNLLKRNGLSPRSFKKILIS